MIPSLVNRISKSLSFGRSSPETSPSGPIEQQSLNRSGSNASSENGNVSSLRRQSTHQLSSEGDYGESVKVSSMSQVTHISSVTVRKELSKRSAAAALGSSQSGSRLSKRPSRFEEKDEAPRSPARSLSKSSSKASSRQASLTKAPSLTRRRSKMPKESFTKAPLTRRGSKKPERSLSKRASLTKAGSKASVRKSSSVVPVPVKKVKPGGRVLWFPAGAYLSVRNESGGYYLCRIRISVYNTSKEVKIRWLTKAKDMKRQRRKSRKGARKSDDGDEPEADEDEYKLSYADEIEPTSILMQVSMEKNGMTFTLNDNDKKETERLLQIAKDVEAGRMDKDEIGADVQEVIIIEPPAKKRRTEGGSSPKEKKPRLKKTASQKERDKEKRAQERKKKKEEGGEARKRKVPKKEEDLMLHPNPKIKVLEKDPLWDTNVHIPYVSKYANARLAFRAIKLNDMKMLKKLLKDPDKVLHLTYQQSLSSPMSPLDYAVKMNNQTAIDLLWEDYFGKKYADRFKQGVGDRLLINRLSTGSYNFRSVGIGRIRKIMASRGAREGNNALTKDYNHISNGGYEDNIIKVHALKTAMKSGASADLLLRLLKEKPLDDSMDATMMITFMQNLMSMLAAGHNVQAAQVLQKVVEACHSYRPLPGLLYQVLLVDKPEDIKSVPPSQITFKSNREMKGFTLIHAAACNPHPGILEKVLVAEPNVLVADAKGRRPIHFAAGCSSPEPLKLLLEKGANPYDTDSDGRTALHYAVHAGRTKNVEILVKLISDENSGFVDPTAGKPNGGLNRACKEPDYIPLHIACGQGHLDIVKLLIRHGANVNIKMPLHRDSVTPLMMAASKGHLNIVRELVDAGAMVEQQDRMGQTALIHATMNGATNVMTYLLNIGASPDRKDTSGNSVLHYAAAYGWYFSVKTLLEAGADPAVSNDWRTTPLSVAYLKGHDGIVSLLLDDERVDVNFPDDKGQTLLSIACSCEPEEGLLKQISFLIKDKGADCTVRDTGGLTPLHCLAAADVYEFDRTELHKVIVKDEAEKVTLSIAKLFVENGFDPALRDNNGNTPAMVALAKRNMELTEYLVEQGSEIYTAFDSNPPVPPNTILHQVAENLFGITGNPNLVIKFLTRTLTVNGVKKTYTKELCEMAQTYNSNGFTPLLLACKVFSEQNFYYDETSSNLDHDCVQFENARTFIQNLVETAKSDVNACTKPIWIDPALNRPRDEDCDSYYSDRQLAKSTSVFYLLGASDPYWDSAKKYKPDVKYTTLKYILSQGAKVNVHNLGGSTPLVKAIETVGNVEAVRVLLKEGKADVNLCKRKWRNWVTTGGERRKKTFTVSPIHCAAMCIPARYDILEELLKHPEVDINARDEEFNNSILHILSETMKEGQLKAMEQVLDKGLSPDVTDRYGRTALHLLVNLAQGGIDENLDSEILLLSRKANSAVQDNLGCIPLHYAFVKFGDAEDCLSNTSSFLDPVEACKLLVKGMKKADLSIADMYGRTPLHYAARRGASICCMYLLQKGAEPNVKDKDGNTPLNLAVMAGHDNCGSVLIQHGVDLCNTVVYVQNTAQKDGKEKPPVWRWKPVSTVKKPEPVKKIPLFQEAIKQNLVGVSFLILEWPVEKSGITFADAVEMAVKNKQYNVALRLLSTSINPAELSAVRDEGRNFLHILALYADPMAAKFILQEKIAKVLIDKGVPVNQTDRFNCTPLLYAVLKQNYNLAFFFSEVAGVLNVKYTDGFGRSLVSAALWNCYFSGPPARLWDWLEMLIKEKADVNKKFDYPLLEGVFGTRFDVNKMQSPDYWQSYPDYGITPLIFLLHCQDFTFTHNILQWGANPNQADASSLMPLMHAVKMNNVKHVKQLLKYDYDPAKDDVEPPKPAARKNVFRLKKMESVRSATSASDSSSDEEEVQEDRPKPKEYRPIKKTSSVNLNATDKRGWTALHYAACSLGEGTFDNDEIVFVLVKAGAKTDMKNSDNQTPLDLALASNAPRVAAMLQKLKGVAEKNMKHPAVLWTEFEEEDNMALRGPVPNFHKDAEKELGGGEEEMEQEENLEATVSEHCNVKDGTIAMDEEQNLPYEVLMTKCEAHLGVWGLYNFYQIQLVHQAGKELYILFTRWGRIGNVGQYQHTPFKTKKEAVKEFCKIFQEKSGNKWENVKNFEEKPRKYRLVPRTDRQPPKKQKDIEFNLESPIKSVLPGSLQRAVKIMMDVKILRSAYIKDRNIDTDVLPFGRFSHEKLLQAKQLLELMGKYVNKIADYRRDRSAKTKEQKEEHQQDCEKVSELSSEYFQLIPQKNFAYEKLRPLDRLKDFDAQFHLVCNLLDFEVTSQMLLGAMFCRNSMNPVDYIYQCLRCKLQLMEEDDPMAQFILRYVYVSAQRTEVKAIYKVQREGEEERLRNCGIDNRRYLWHGTDIGNLLSILSRGLVVAPLDTQLTGALFGKGIYFSDLFKKSENYCRAHNYDDDSQSFMLLCEVALGKQHVFVDSPSFDEERSGYNSTLALGRYFPSPDYDVRFPSGAAMPLGDEVEDKYYEDPKTGEKVFKHSLCNGFVAYSESQVCIRYLVNYS